MIDCLVIGAGQAGLSCADLLQKMGLDYLVIDGGARIGDVWRDRPRNLRLFTSRRFCQLGDMPMPGAQNGFPAAAEFADYLDQFVSAHALRVRMNHRAVRLASSNDTFVAALRDGQMIRARTVIDATGANQVARIPAYASELDPAVRQLTGASYRDPGSVGTGRSVLVVGDGASGRQIAMELASTHQVALATGRVRKLLPNVVLGRDIFWWLTKSGVLFAPAESPVARIMRQRDPLPARDARNVQLRLVGVQVLPRAVGVLGDKVLFSDGAAMQPGCVIWCAGYEQDLSWLALDRIEIENGQVHHARGRTAQPGYFVTGRKWLTCRASELVLGAGADAVLVTGYVADYISEKRSAVGLTSGVQ